MSKKILIVDDSPDIRRLIRAYIESNTDWQVCGEAGDGRAAVDLVQRLNPDLLVLDLAMPVMGGIEAAREIAAIAPKTTIILFTVHDSKQLAMLAQSVGIRAVLSKLSDGALDHLIAALREVAAEPPMAAA